MGEDFPRNIRQSIMGRASSGVDRRDGRKKGRELVCRWRGGAGGVNNGGPDLLRKPAVDLARTCHFQGALIFYQERTYVKQVKIPTRGWVGETTFLAPHNVGKSWEIFISMDT